MVPQIAATQRKIKKAQVSSDPIERIHVLSWSRLISIFDTSFQFFFESANLPDQGENISPGILARNFSGVPGWQPELFNRFKLKIRHWCIHYHLFGEFSEESSPCLKNSKASSASFSNSDSDPIRSCLLCAYCQCRAQIGQRRGSSPVPIGTVSLLQLSQKEAVEPNEPHSKEKY